MTNVKRYYYECPMRELTNIDKRVNSTPYKIPALIQNITVYETRILLSSSYLRITNLPTFLLIFIKRTVLFTISKH